MGQFYGIETDLYGMVTDAKSMDEQAATERVFNAMLRLLFTINVLVFL